MFLFSTAQTLYNVNSCRNTTTTPSQISQGGVVSPPETVSPQQCLPACWMVVISAKGCQLGNEILVSETGFGAVDAEMFPTVDILTAWQVKPVEVGVGASG